MLKVWTIRILRALGVGFVGGLALLVAISVYGLGAKGAIHFANNRLHCLGFVVSSSFARFRATTPEPIEAEIQAAVIRDLLQYFGWPGQTVAIRQLTMQPPPQFPEVAPRDSRHPCFGEEFPGRDLISGLTRVNAASRFVANNLDLQLPYRLVNPYATLAPENVVSVSRPAINHAKDRALIFFEVTGPWLHHGLASYLLYGKSEGEWELVDGCNVRG
jgi:hypothetical protein